MATSVALDASQRVVDIVAVCKERTAALHSPEGKTYSVSLLKNPLSENNAAFYRARMYIIARWIYSIALVIVGTAAMVASAVFSPPNIPLVIAAVGIATPLWFKHIWTKYVDKAHTQSDIALFSKTILDDAYSQLRPLSYQDLDRHVTAFFTGIGAAAPATAKESLFRVLAAIHGNGENESIRKGLTLLLAELRVYIRAENFMLRGFQESVNGTHQYIRDGRFVSAQHISEGGETDHDVVGDQCQQHPKETYKLCALKIQIAKLCFSLFYPQPTLTTSFANFFPYDINENHEIFFRETKNGRETQRVLSPQEVVTLIAHQPSQDPRDRKPTLRDLFEKPSIDIRALIEKDQNFIKGLPDTPPAHGSTEDQAPQPVEAILTGASQPFIRFLATVARAPVAPLPVDDAASA